MNHLWLPSDQTRDGRKQLVKLRDDEFLRYKILYSSIPVIRGNSFLAMLYLNNIYARVVTPPAQLCGTTVSFSVLGPIQTAVDSFPVNRIISIVHLN
jgi:hypothetical protein